MPYKILKYSIVDDEIEKVIAHYDSISQKLGIKFERAIEATFDKLEINPHYYFNLGDKKHRRILINSFPYAFVYTIEEDIVFIKIFYPQQDDPAILWTYLNK